jgi:hypothetical protein
VKSNIGPKIPPKIMKMKNIAAQDMRTVSLKDSWIDANQEFTRCGNILPLFGRLGRSITSLLSSLRHEARPHLAK